MHSLKQLRAEPAAFDHGLARRGLPPVSQSLLALDKQARSGKTELQQLQQQANECAKKIGEAKSKGLDATEFLERSKQLKAEISARKAAQETEGEDHPSDAILEALQALPNLPAADVPDGTSEADNQEVRRVGTPRSFAFTPTTHEALGEALGLMDFETASKLSGSRFVILKGALAKLERALAAFMLSVHTEEFGYTECAVPLLVKSNAMFGAGQLPKFADDAFRTTNEYWLVPTAEVSLANMAADSVREERELPLRLTAFTPCFRSEAGAAGRDTRGMIRQHQFYKVELVSITREEDSNAEHERMTGAAEEILKRLDLPYRVMLLCAQDMGFSARKTYDLEVWLPGQQAYREISSCSNCGDFQARRMNARYRDSAGELRYAHTLNGSGLAVGRTLIAVLENYQNADGSITIPEVLRPFLNGLEILR